MKFKFTKELKEKWLNSLKSGEYEQYGGRLQHASTDKKKCCCLGVLANLLPDIVIDDETNDRCIGNSMNLFYKPFEDMFKDNLVKLTSTNDNSYISGRRDYSAVIPLIEELSTTD